MNDYNEASSLDEQIRQAVYGEITRLFAYGVDWTEIRDKSKDDHEVSTFAAKIKDDFAKEVTNTLAREISTIISNAVKELVAEARIDELKHLVEDGGIWYQDMTRQFPQKITLNQRIKELEV